jgi:[protein-PII] uridylyltransferase
MMNKTESTPPMVDRAALLATLKELAGGEESVAEIPRAGILACLKEALSTGRAELRQRLEDGARGEEVVRANSRLMDELLGVIYDFTVERVFPLANPTAGERLCLVATGGYGRGELAPFSDIDLLFLLPWKQTPHTEQVVEFILYILWDLGLKVGHATRSLNECIRRARADITIRTAVLEARYLWGEHDLYDELKQRFASEVRKGTDVEFVEAKLAERHERHARMGGSRYVLEPNVKEGKGGLRDLHTLFWIAKYLYGVEDNHDLVGVGVLNESEYRKFARVENFLWSVRCQLHYLVGRGEDRLTFEVQAEIARRAGYADRPGIRGVERFMKHYFLVAKEVGSLTRIFCAQLEEQHKRRPRLRLPFRLSRHKEIDGFRLDGDRLTGGDNQAFEHDPLQMIRLFHVAECHRLDVHPDALRAITRALPRIDSRVRKNPEANRLFLEILSSRNDPETALRRMNEAGVLGRMVPEFGRVVAQMQHDMYHVYTVDEHTIFAIGILAGIEEGGFAEEMPVATEIIHKLHSREVLYLAVFLHDIAKGRGGNHSELGAEMVQKLAPRMGMSPEDTETIAWLVRHHLLMSNTAFKRDVNDPRTIHDFVAIVQSPERLRLLLVLTVADIRAVGPHVWNGWKGGLLRELYFRTEEALLGGLAHEAGGMAKERVAAAQEALRAELPDWSEDEFTAHLALGGPPYWLAFEPAALARHARLIRVATSERRELSVETRIDNFRSVTEVTVHTADNPGLFAAITGAMAVAGANIVDAKIFTLANGWALDTFWIQDAAHGAFAQPNRLARLSTLIERARTGRLEVERELEHRPAAPSRTQIFTVALRVIVDNQASATHTVIEVNGRDRPGFLYACTQALTELDLQIASAHISTFGERVVDVFYVQDAAGMKVDDEVRFRHIRERLELALG